MQGNPKKNKWCCFCCNWFDPACQTISKMPHPDMFNIVDNKKFNVCSARNIRTNALASCPKYKNKFQ